MIRSLPLVLLVACGGEVGIRDRDDTEDLSRFDGATLRIVEPRSAAFLPLGATHTFRAEVVAADGTVLEDAGDIAWTSSVDPGWSGAAPTFTDDTLDVGLHEITARAELPNGDRLGYTVGGVLVQAEAAGTYVGTITTGFVLQGFPVSCGGSATLIVEPYGREATGKATCLASAGGFDIPLEYSVDVDVSPPQVDGVIQVRIIAFDLDFPAQGTLVADELGLDFAGNVFGSDFDGRIRTRRISRDAGL
jgi:hypothetical protein